MIFLELFFLLCSFHVYIIVFLFWTFVYDFVLCTSYLFNNLIKTVMPKNRCLFYVWVFLVYACWRQFWGFRALFPLKWIHLSDLFIFLKSKIQIPKFIPNLFLYSFCFIKLFLLVPILLANKSVLYSFIITLVIHW